MTRWRVAVTAFLLVAVGMPLALPFLDLLVRYQGWRAWAEVDRLVAVAGNTLQLVLGTLLVVMPLGIAGAILLYRTDLPGRRALRFLTMLTLFVPLPLFASAWQAALGTGGWLPVAVWNAPLALDSAFPASDLLGRPWAHGLGPAIWIHAVAGLPWVILLVGQGLLWVERELEEDALLDAGPGRVLWSVTLRRARPAVAAAGLWVAVLTATDITVTDMMQVRTFAEEVYLQYVAGDHTEPLARAVAVSVPLVLLLWCLVIWVVSRWQRLVPPLRTTGPPPLLFPLGKARWPCLAGLLVVVVVLSGVPLASLVWKAGLTGTPQGWSMDDVVINLVRAFRKRGGLVEQSFSVALAAGVLASLVALVTCWLAAGSRWLLTLGFSVLAVALAVPGPIAGIGLKEAIAHIMDVEELVSSVWGGGGGPARAVLYQGPSPLPVLWAYLVRFLPYAVGLLWPVVRLVPRELLDAARVDGATPSQELGHVLLPLTLPACIRAALVVAILSLGEISAAKLVETPGWTPFAGQVFEQMHYGVTNDLASLCLVLLAMVLAGGTLVAIMTTWMGRRQY